MTENQQPAVIVKDLYKSFRLPHEQHNGIKQVIINFANRKKGYEVQHVLSDVSFEIKKGEFFGIVGRNGSGKSTLLKLLAGIYSPDKGLVQINGSLTPFIELGVGFNPELTGHENVFLNGALLGFSRQEMKVMYDDIVAFAELENFMDQKLKNYSSGMQVRLAFSIAIRADTDILVLDEVLAVGDEEFQRKCHQYFKSLQKNKKTVILVTHSMNAVREYCDRAILLDAGEVIIDETDVDHVADEYSKLFLDTPNANIIDESGDRFGTEEVKFQNIKHSYNKDNLTIAFDIKNTTDVVKSGVEFSFNIYSDGELVTGNGTKYTKNYKQGLSLMPQETISFEVDIPNNFGNFTFEVNMILRGDSGYAIYDEIKPAFKFKSNNTHMAQFLRFAVPLTIRKG